MTFLRDQLAAAKVNRIKRRIAAAWQARTVCDCPVCQARRTGGAAAPIAALLRIFGDNADADPLYQAPAPGAPKH